MRLTSFWLAFICAASLVVAGQDDSSVQSKIIALEKAWNQAYKAGTGRLWMDSSMTRLCWSMTTAACKTRPSF